MQKYSIFNLIKNAFSGHQNWDLAWKDPTPKKEYDVVIIGGGGHGLATAYYLAKEHNITNVAIIEKGWMEVEMLEEIPQSLDQTTCMMITLYLVNLEWIYGER